MAKIGLERFKPDKEHGQEEIEVFGSQVSEAYQRGVSERKRQYSFIASIKRPLRHSGSYEWIIKARKITSPPAEEMEMLLSIIGCYSGNYLAPSRDILGSMELIVQAMYANASTKVLHYLSFLPRVLSAGLLLHVVIGACGF